MSNELNTVLMSPRDKIDAIDQKICNLLLLDSYRAAIAFKPKEPIENIDDLPDVARRTLEQKFVPEDLP